MKLYFDKSQPDEGCRTPTDWIRWHDLRPGDEITLVEAQRIPMSDSWEFWCIKHKAAGDTDEGLCGKSCEDYKPRNGKWGICKYHGNMYSLTDNEITITI